MISPSDLQGARERISDLFAQQCIYGIQNEALPPDTAACGQFIGPDARDNPQAGLHGTAAALRVLSDSEDTDIRALIPRLIRYIGLSLNLDPAVGIKPSETDGLGAPPTFVVDPDAENVIKLSEVLYALHFVRPAVAATDHLKAEIARRLGEGMRENRGWGYFLDSPAAEIDVLPTAYAVRALSIHGYETGEAKQYLLQQLEARVKSEGKLGSDIMVSVLSLFVLTFSGRGNGGTMRDQLRNSFRDLWRRLRPLMDQDLEQNVEYRTPHVEHRGKGKNAYVRIPWQLYLLALASRLAEIRAFATRPCQDRLSSIITDVRGEGFYYPYSGNRVSSRTNAILYDALALIEREMKHRWAYDLVAGFDRFRRVLSSNWVLYPIGFVMVAGIVISVYYWISDSSTGRLADLAPEFVGWLAVSLLLMTLRKPR